MPRKKKESAMTSEFAVEAATPTTESAPATPKKKKAGRPKGRKNKSVKKMIKRKAPKGYAPATKAKILAAAKGKPLAEAHIAAVGAGFRGTAASLYQMIYNARKKKGKRGRPKGSKNAAPTIRRGPGRPPKANSAALSGGLGEVESIVAREVRNRINQAARAAIAELEKLIS